MHLLSTLLGGKERKHFRRRVTFEYACNVGKYRNRKRGMEKRRNGGEREKARQAERQTDRQTDTPPHRPSQRDRRPATAESRQTTLDTQR